MVKKTKKVAVKPRKAAKVAPRTLYVYTPAMQQRLAKLDEKIAQATADAREADAAYRKAREEDAKVSTELKKTLKNVSKQWGDFGRGEGEIIEEEFRRALCEKKSIGDFKELEVLEDSIKDRFEYDLVGFNSQVVFVGEVKRQLTARDVRNFADKRLPYFKEDFPKYSRRRKVYGMVGGLRVNEDVANIAKACNFVVLRLKDRALQVENPPSFMRGAQKEKRRL